MRQVMIALLMLVMGCSSPPSASVRQRSSVPCATARSFGAVPDDGMDDRVSLQAVLDACAGGTVELESGTYSVVTPLRPTGRPIAMITVPPDTALEGGGVSTTVIEFSGNNGGYDWRGLQLTSGDALRRLRLVSKFVAGTTVEQTHIARVDGPARGIVLADLSCSHPQNGSKSGDCVQVVGYVPDKVVWDVDVGHVDFEASGRSGFGIHSGLHGTMRPDGHWTTRVHDCHFGDIRDQPVDGEGSGDIDGMEIDHNVFDYPVNIEGAASIQIQSSSRIYIHDNKLNGRGIDMYGCDACVLEHNTVEQVAAGLPAMQLRKKGAGVRFVDETYSRSAASGTGAVVIVAQKLTAPENVVFDHVRLTQHTPAPLVATLGVAGLEVTGSRLAYDGTGYVQGSRIDALSISGSGAGISPSCTDNQVASEYPGIRTTRIRLADNSVSGPYRATATVSGSYCGTGAIEMLRNKASGPQQGLRCEEVATGSGVTGPVTVRNNDVPPNTCALVP